MINDDIVINNPLVLGERSDLDWNWKELMNDETNS